MNPCLKPLVGFSLLSMLFCAPIYSQENQPDNQGVTPISFYGSVGISGAWVTGSGYVEAILTTPSHVNPFIRIGIAGATGFAIGSHLALEGGVLFGAGKSHFEITGGYHYGFSKYYDFLPFGGSVGYRYQKPEGGFIFRTGIGYTEGLYVGIGYRIKS